MAFNAFTVPKFVHAPCIMHADIAASHLHSKSASKLFPIPVDC